jgi:hypothetical protein
MMVQGFGFSMKRRGFTLPQDFEIMYVWILSYIAQYPKDLMDQILIKMRSVSSMHHTFICHKNTAACGVVPSHQVLIGQSCDKFDHVL